MLNRVAQRMNVQINEVDIDTDDDLVKRYGLRVPVLLAAHDRVIAEGVIDDRTLLRDALEREFSL